MSYTAPIQEGLLLESFHLVSLNFNLEQSNWENVMASKDTKFNIKFKALLKDSHKDYFGVLFNVVVENKDTGFNLNFEFVGNFKVNGIDVDLEVIEKHPFFRQSAPAIVFPYIRSFITSFSNNAGFAPVILPSLNFSEAKKEKED